MKEFIDNVDFSKEWLTKEIIKTDIEDKKTNKKNLIRISKIDLLKLILKFIKLNERGCWLERQKYKRASR